MAKILVADDNSNVQKTVALALADMGVSVTSVNNGEAAVRKLADFSPDLVLADIFMPVRNGYEVCEHIKKDPRFSRVPVVLLVGAFDPLDEREAQRVGADGILKKPFVPPDPLIAMVKTLLDRTMGDRLVAVSVSEPAVAMQARGRGSVIAEAHPSESETRVESSTQEFPAPIENVRFGKDDHPVAFGQLLETPTLEMPRADASSAGAAIEPVDDEQILIRSRDATLGEPIFWKNDSPEPEPDAEQSETETDSESEPGLELRTWKETSNSLTAEDDAASLKPIEPLELVHEEADASMPSVVDTNIVQLDPAAQAPLTVEPTKAQDLAANPLEWMATAPPAESHDELEPSPGWDEPIPDASDTIDVREDAEALSVPVPVETHVTDRVPDHAPIVDLPAAEVPNKVSPVTTLSGAAPEPLIPVAKKTQGAPTVTAQGVEDTVRSLPRNNWADLAASLNAGSTTSVLKHVQSELVDGTNATSAGNAKAPGSNSLEAQAPDPALVEAVVQRVLDKMRPQVVDIITKEFLRPIVQALVHREIEKH